MAQRCDGRGGPMVLGGNLSTDGLVGQATYLLEMLLRMRPELGRRRRKILGLVILPTEKLLMTTTRRAVLATAAIVQLLIRPRDPRRARATSPRTCRPRRRRSRRTAPSSSSLRTATVRWTKRP